MGRIELSVQPFHRGALDLYVPLVDWGARFARGAAPGAAVRGRADRGPRGRGAPRRGPAPGRGGGAEGGPRRGGVLPARASAGGVRLRPGRRADHGAGRAGARSPAGALAVRHGDRNDARALPRPGAAAAPARRDRRSRVLRERSRHPGRAAGDRAGAGLRAHDLGGAERAAGGPGAAGGGQLAPRAGARPPPPGARLGPAQQPARAAGARPRGGEQAALLRRRPDLERLAVRVHARATDRADRPPVRVRLRQPRLGRARAAGWPSRAGSC